MSTSFYTMKSSLNIDNNNNDQDYDDDEQAPLDNNSQPLDEHILSIIRKTKKDEQNGHRTIRPALLASELGLSVEDATKELCGLLSAVGGGNDGACFVFEKVDMPGQDISNKATTMVFTFPHDFEVRAKKYRRQSDMKQRFQLFTTGLIKFIKVFTAFGLIISLAVLIIAGICLLVAAVIALARGGHNGGGGHRNHPLMHRLRYLFFQLRQILWLYAICGSAVDGNQDPFMRECAGDLAFMMSMFCGNPMHPFFWFRVGGLRRRWARVRRTRGWGDSNGNVDAFWTRGDGRSQSIMRRGTWGDDNEEDDRMINQSSSNGDQQRGLLSIAVELLFGPDGNTSDDNIHSSKELQKWKFRASVIISLSTTSEGNGISLRELLPFVDNPPASADHPSAIRETLRLVTYFNGQPVGGIDSESSGGIDARFCFPELVSEMDYTKLLTIGSSRFAPPSQHAIENRANVSSILYREDREFDFGSSENASNGTPEYLYEQPLMLTQLSRTQFGQCVLLGILNFVGIIWVQNALSPGGMFALPLSAKSVSGGRSLIALASVLLLKLLNILRFYSKLFLLLPFSRMIIVVVRNLFVDKRNKRREGFVRAEL